MTATLRLMTGLTALAMTAATLVGCGYQALGTTAAAQDALSVRAASVPSGFMWGVSTAGYQWEGRDTTSQWAAWDAAGKTSERNVDAANGYQLFDEDASLAQGMGCNIFRTSIEWSRIEPQEGVIDQAAVAHYHQLFATFRAHGLTPVVTLMHFSYPAWLDKYGGWEDAQTPQRFAKYCAFIAKEFGPEIKYYLTFNEPNVFLLGGYVAGTTPPGKHNPIAGYQAMQHMIQAHGLAYDAIHAADPDAQVSFNMYTASYALGATQASADPTTQQLGSDTAFADAAMGKSAMGKGLRDSKSKMDFASFDYYCRLHISLPVQLPRPDQWEVYPQGMYDAVHRYYNRYHLPIFIAENGLATWNLQPRADGWTRAAYTVAHVQQVQKAMAEGIPVIGYSQWSITDNYEWGSFGPRFGLYSVDCRDQNFTRVPTDGVDAYKSIIANGGATATLAARFPAPRL